MIQGGRHSNSVLTEKLLFSHVCAPELTFSNRTSDELKIDFLAISSQGWKALFGFLLSFSVRKGKKIWSSLRLVKPTRTRRVSEAVGSAFQVGSKRRPRGIVEIVGQYLSTMSEKFIATRTLKRESYPGSDHRLKGLLGDLLTLESSFPQGWSRIWLRCPPLEICASSPFDERKV